MLFFSLFPCVFFSSVVILLFPSPNPHFSTAAAVSAAAAVLPLLPVVFVVLVVFSSFPKSQNPETPNKYSKNRIFEVLLFLSFSLFCF